MQVRVLFFGQLKDICGKAEEAVELPAGSTLGAVFEHYAGLYPKLRTMAASIVLARNQAFAPLSDLVGDGDEVALLPPVSGGSGHIFELTRDPIDVRALENRVLQGIDGAVVTFHGVVRNNTKGRETLRLEYECYEGMALKLMEQIGLEIAAGFAISRIAMVHRLGILEIGEASVVVIATAPHRRPAFDAAREGIDRLKKLVPVWKKEYFADGEVWVDGEWDDAAPKADGSAADAGGAGAGV